MDNEIMDDICCATCFLGELCQDVDTGYYIHCKNDNEDHSEDEVCDQYNLVEAELHL